MEASLLYLVLDVAAVLLAKVAEDFGENPFQGVVAYGTLAGAFGILHGYVAVIAKVEGGAIKVAAVFSGIVVAAAELIDILLRT